MWVLIKKKNLEQVQVDEGSILGQTNEPRLKGEILLN